MTMKTPTKRRDLLAPFLIILVLAGWAAHGFGRRHATARVVSPSDLAPGAHIDRAEVAKSGITKPFPNNSSDSKRYHTRIMEAWSSVPDTDLQPVAIAEIHRIIKRMSSRDISDFLAGFSGNPRLKSLRWTIYEAWVLQDGPAAMRSLSEANPIYTGPLEQTAWLGSAWLRSRPEEAEAWMRSVRDDSEWKMIVESTAVYAMNDSKQSDPTGDFWLLDCLPPTGVAEQLGLWAGRYARSPEIMDKIRSAAAATGRPEDMEFVDYSMLRAWAVDSPQAARQYLERLGPEDESRDKLEVGITLGMARSKPREAFQNWTDTHPDISAIPRDISKGLGDWVARNSQEAKTWLESLPAGALRESLHAAAVEGACDKYNPENGAEILTKMEPGDKKTEAARELNRRWSFSSPRAAESWRNSLSESDRADLSE